MWEVSWGRLSFSELPSFQQVIGSLQDCPEGVASYGLANYALLSDQRQFVVAAIANATKHFNAPTLHRRLRLGAWPEFGVAARVLQDEVPRLRFPETADLLMNATPRFAMATSPAPHLVLAGWWWSHDYGDFSGIYTGGGEVDSSVDLGMQVLLQSPILKMGSELLLIDVGVFDGTSLFSLGLRAGMNHSVLGFEPLNKNRKLILENTYSREGHMLESFRLLAPDAWTCSGIDKLGVVVPKPCACNPSIAGGCAHLASVGLSAADYDTEIAEMGAFSALTMVTFGGEFIRTEELHEAASVGHASLREGAPIVERWVREALGRSCVDIHLLKIDTEGCEFASLRGMEPLLAEHRVHFIFIEVWPMALMTTGADPLGVLKFLAHYGFLCRFLGNRRSETFEEFIKRHTSDLTMSDFFVTRHNSFDDLLCEDIYWKEPCGPPQKLQQR